MYGKAIILCTVLLLAGCSEGIKESDFIDALKTSKKAQLCFNGGDVLGVAMFGEKEGEHYLAEEMTIFRTGLKTLPKLVEKGYVEREPIKLRVNYQTHNAYKLTEKGRQYFKWGEPICIGDRTVTDIIEYTEPAEDSGTKYTAVTFSYEIKLNDFPSDAGLEEQLRESLGLDGEGEALFIKTNKGWRLERESW